MMFLVGVSLVAIGEKLAPGLAGRLRIYKMSNRQICQLDFRLWDIYYSVSFLRRVQGARRNTC